MSSDGAAVPPPAVLGADDRLGTVIDGRYRLVELLGSGGMGHVYRAEHIHIHREVALKLLHARLGSHDVIGERFEREAVAIGRLDHPNCVYVQDFGRTPDGLPYLVMELLRGTPLDLLITQRNPVPWPRALHIARHVLHGLAHAHEAGIVHRDIKPENIVLVEREGDADFAKLLDFGIAKLRGEGSDLDRGGRELTEAGMAFGTPTYMSPEQAYGLEVDGRADLYALSIVLVELITGRPPFKAPDKLAVLAMHTSKPVPRLGELNPAVQVPDAVETLLRRGLAKEPEQRFHDAATFIAAIDDTLRGSGQGVAAPTAAMHAPRPAAPLPRPRAERSVPSPSAGLPRALPSAPVVYGEPSGTAPLFLPPGHRRWAWLAAVAAAIAGLALLGLALSGSSQDARNAAALRDGGDPGAAIQYLERRGDDIARDAEAQLQLGHAYAANGDPPRALRAYAAAVELDPRHVTDAQLLANVAPLVDHDDPELALEAGALLLRAGEHAAAEARIAREASNGRRLPLRARARELARAHGLTDRVEFVASYGLDLRQGRTCEQRLEAVLALRSLGDPQAIPLLRKARVRGGGSRFDRTNRNACLKDAADEAIAYLEQQSPPPP